MDWLEKRDDLRELILKDVNYTESSFKEDVARLREWFRLQPHLPQSTSDHVLEVFLLASKSLERAKEKLDSYFSARTAYPTFFCDGDPKKLVQATQGFNVMYLPKLTEDGCRVIFINFKENCDTMSVDMKDYYSKIFLLADYWYNFGPLSSGVVAFFDFTHFKLSLIPKILGSSVKTSIKIGQETNPVRPKKFLIYNAVSAVSKLLEILLSYANPKFSKRVVFIEEGDTETIKKYIPAHALPEDYGGKDSTSSQLTKDWDNVLLGATDWCQQQKLAKSDESKRLGKPNSFITDLNFGLDGTFKKLSID